MLFGKSSRMALAAALLVMAGGCGRQETEEFRFVVILDNYPANLDPRIGTDQSSARFHKLVFEGLTRIDEHAMPQPALAEGWDMPSPTEYVFHLRRDAVFHHGKPLRAEDVVFSYRELLKDGFVSAKKEPYEVLESVEAADDFTVHFRLKRPFASFLYSAALGIVPADGAHTAARPVGTGPFAFEEARRDEYIHLKAHARHPHPPSIAALELRVVPDSSTRLLLLQKGEAHLAVNSVAASSLKLFRESKAHRVMEGPGANLSYIGFNLEDPVLRNVKVRSALAHAVNRRALMEGLLDGMAVEANGILPPHHWAAEPEAFRFTYDPAAAERLLDEAGFPRRGGEPRFRLLYKTSTDETARQRAALLQEQFAAVGVALDIRSFEFATFYEDIRNGNFQIFSLNWVGLDDPDFLFSMFHSTSVPPAGSNRGRYRNPGMDRLLEAARLEFDTPRRAEYYRRVQRLAGEDYPYVPLWHFQNVAVVDRRLEGFRLPPSGDFTSLGEAQWLP